jgi:hypothetical protein
MFWIWKVKVQSETSMVNVEKLSPSFSSDVLGQ